MSIERLRQRISEISDRMAAEQRIGCLDTAKRLAAIKRGYEQRLKELTSPQHVHLQEISGDFSRFLEN